MPTPAEIKQALDFLAFFENELGKLRPGSNGNSLGFCPFHKDRVPSFSVNLENGLWHCFGCGAAGDVFDFAQRKWNCDFPTALRELARLAGLDPDEETRQREKEGLTLEQFAAAKNLPVDFLIQHGVKQARGKDERPYVVFAYRGLEGQIIKEATRLRFSLSERPMAKRGGKPHIYGLWRISEMLAEDGELNLVEGESDCLTAWLYGLSAVGVPGKTLLKILGPEFFKDFKNIYVWEEPGAEGWAKEIAARLSSLSHLRIFAMTPPEGIKDLSEAHCRGLDVVATVRRMQREAKEVTCGQNANEEYFQENQADTSEGEEKYKGNQGDNDDSHYSRNRTNDKTRISTISNIIGYRKNLAKEGYDPFLCRQVIEYLEKSSEQRSIAAEVREWALTTSGHFMTTDVYRELDLTTRDHKKAAVMALIRLEAEGLIEKCGPKRGCYRRIEKELEPIDFKNAPDGPPLPLQWPLGLEDLVALYPKNLAVVAGVKDAGKTALLLNLARLNQDLFDTHYFCSEIAAQEFKHRLQLFGFPLETWKIKVWERSSNFADVIKPDSLNIIDYLEISENFYLIAQEMGSVNFLV